MKTLNCNMMYRGVAVGSALLIVLIFSTTTYAQSATAKSAAESASGAHVRIDGLNAKLAKLKAAMAVASSNLKVQIKVEINKLNVKITRLKKAKARSARSARRANRKAKRLQSSLLKMRITSAVAKAEHKAGVANASTTSHTTLGQGSQSLAGLAFGVVPSKKTPVRNGARKAAAQANGKQSKPNTSMSNACIARGGSPRVLVITDRLGGDATLTDIKCDMPTISAAMFTSPTAVKSDSSQKGVTTKSLLVSCGIGALGGGALGVATPGVMQGMGHEVSGADYGVGVGAGAAGGCAVGALLHLAGLGQ